MSFLLLHPLLAELYKIGCDKEEGISMKLKLCVAAAAAFVALPSLAEDIKLRIASGHPTANTYVNLMNTFFVPEVAKRVAARTKHKVEFVEGYA
jgi:TRAP-type C4-dicarboxylate transport system substrate-binding protein